MQYIFYRITSWYTNVMYTEKTFIIPKLYGISEENISEHLGLYRGYIKHANLITEELTKDHSDFIKTELNRRLGFEIGGIKNHELFFAQFEGGTGSPWETSLLYKKICEKWGNFESWKAEFTMVAKTRSIGWAFLSYDTENKTLRNHWIDEQHIGQLTHHAYLVGIDMWEHSYVADYKPSGKPQYIEDFLRNINWGIAEKMYKDLA